MEVRKYLCELNRKTILTQTGSGETFGPGDLMSKYSMRKGQQTNRDKLLEINLEVTTDI